MANRARRTAETSFNQWLIYRPGEIDTEIALIAFPAAVDSEATALAAYQAMLPELAPGYVSLADLQAMYSNAIQQHLDNMARERGYDGIHTAISYRDDPNPAYAAEALALFNWRSAVWTGANAMLAAVNPASPPTIEAVLAGLPAFAWPE